MRLFAWCLVCSIACCLPALGAATLVGDQSTDAALEQRAYDAGLAAYFFFYPLIVMELTRQQSMQTRAAMNQFFHMAGTPAASDKLVVRLNVDALYSMAWVDVGGEPQILTVPEMRDHSYVFQLLDAWSDVFASPGTRVTGSGAGSFALVPLCWQGRLPAGLQKIECPTSLVWIIGRIVLHDDADIPQVRKLQTGFTLTPLSAWGTKKGVATAVSPLSNKIPTATDMPAPVTQLDAMGMEAYFDMAMQLLKTTKTHSNDWPLMTQLTALGVVPGGAVQKLNPSVVAGLGRGFTRAIQLLKDAMQNVPQQTVNGWYMDTRIGTYGTDYFTRALIAKIGLGALLPQDTVYPSTYVDGEGRPLDGAYRYVLHFEREELPPARALWSVTLYNQESFFAENPLHRYGLRSRDPLIYNSDGSLDLYIQHEQPTEDKMDNWLPAPADKFTLSARLGWPEESVLYGGWHMPGIRRVGKMASFACLR